MVTVSVHIVTYNSAQYIKKCIEAVMNQTHTVDQIVVVDNDSKDNTLEILSSVSDPRMKIIKNTRNVGFAAGHNIAIQHSNCDYYLVLNPDVELHPDYVFYLVKFMEERLDVGSCTGKLIRMSDQSILDSTGISIYRSRKAVDRGSKQHIDQWVDRCEVFGVSGAAAMYRKEMVEDISIDGEFFDELFFAYKEDVDVAWRARILGWKSYYIPDSTAYHERGWKEERRKRQNIIIRRHSYINRYYMILKNDRWLWIFKHFIYVIPYEIASFLLLIKEPGLIPSWLDLTRNFKTLMRKRKKIMEQRSISNKELYSFFIRKIM